MEIQEAGYLKVPGGFRGLGREGKFYTFDELKNCSFISEAAKGPDDDAQVVCIEGQTDVGVNSQVCNDVQSDIPTESLQNYIDGSQHGYISYDTDYSLTNYNNIYKDALPFIFGYNPSYLTQADCCEIEKHYVYKKIDADFNHAERRDKASVDTGVYIGKKMLDIGAEDIKDNLPHKVSESEGFLFYDSPATNKSFKLSGCRYIEAEILVSNHPDSKRIVHIQGENRGVKNFYIAEDSFYSDDKLLEKLAKAGIHFKFTRRNKVELLNELRIYLASLYSDNIRTIPHHDYWNYLPDGSVWFAEPGSESEVAIINPSGNKVIEQESPWEFVKSDPLVYLKLVILIALNRVAYILTKLLNQPKKWILLLVDEGQKQAAAALFKGARLITECMGHKDIGNLLTSTYSGFAIYLYKSGNKNSSDKLRMISEIVEDGSWDGKTLTTIPLIISESSIPEGLTNFFTIVDNSQLSDVKLDDLILDSADMNDLIREFPGICKREKLVSDYGYLYFSAMYAFRTLNSERISQDEIQKLVDNLISADENNDGFISCSTDFINALFKYVEDESVALYYLKDVPAEFDSERDVLFDDSYVFLSKRCFSKVVASFSSDIGINSLKKALLEDEIIVPNGGSTYTAKPSLYIAGIKKNPTMLRLQRNKLRDSLRRPDLVDFKKLKGGV